MHFKNLEKSNKFLKVFIFREFLVLTTADEKEYKSIVRR